MGYWSYYAAWLLLSYLMMQPKLLFGLAVLLVLRRVLPAPGPIVRALSRGRALRKQLALNPKNAVAARDLASLELDLLRPGAALRWVELGLARSPEDAELLYLGGLALHRLGRHEQALARLVDAVERDPRLRFGHPYLVAGESLVALGRWEEALDAFDRALGINSSEVRGYLGRARAHHARGERAECKRELDEAESTLRCLPHHLRRGQRAARLTVLWLRIRLLREPRAALKLALLGVGAVLAAGLAAGLVWFAWSVASYGDEDETFVLGDERCQEARREGERSAAYLGCVAHATLFPHSYMEASDYDEHIEVLRALGLRIVPISGKRVATEGTDTYTGDAIFLPGRGQARYLVLHRIFGHRAGRWADFTDEALTPPLELERSGDDLAIRDARGRVLPLPDEGSPCPAEVPDARVAAAPEPDGGAHAALAADAGS